MCEQVGWVRLKDWNTRAVQPSKEAKLEGKEEGAKSQQAPLSIIRNLSLDDKQSIVDLLFMIEPGYVSIRRVASEIMRAHQPLPDGCCEGCNKILRPDEYNTDGDGVGPFCDACASELEREHKEEQAKAAEKTPCSPSVLVAASTVDQLQSLLAYISVNTDHRYIKDAANEGLSLLRAIINPSSSMATPSPKESK